MIKIYVRRSSGFATLAAINRSRKLAVLLVAVAAALLISFSHEAALRMPTPLANQETPKGQKPSQTVFTYQGQLRDGSLPANDTYDIQFNLHAARMGGEELGSITHEGLVLTNGLLKVQLDFGQATLESSECWLEVAVRRNGSQESYTVLSPRQKLTPMPYAIFAQAESLSLIGGAVGFPGRVDAKTASETAPSENKLEKGGEIQAAGSNVAVAPQGTPNYIAKFDGAGNPTAISSMFENPTNGNLGIGTPDPAARLEISSRSIFGLRGSPALIVSRNQVAICPSGLCGPARIVDLSISGEGRMGLGTEGPTGKLQVNSELNQSLVIQDTRAGSNWSYIQWNKNNGSRDWTLGRRRGGDFALWSEGIRSEALSVQYSTGNIGVGVATPTAKLDVAGLTKTQVLQITGGSDLSEQFEVNGAPNAGNEVLPAQVQPGKVVSIDLERPGQLVVSNQAYDRRVAGIISGAGGVAPGVLMSQSGSVADGSHPVALTGRVYCWADASNGPINPGDLLTTADTPGHAMKVTDHAKAQGAIIGKAMTSLAKGRGLVLVLVTLQ